MRHGSEADFWCDAEQHRRKPRSGHIFPRVVREESFPVGSHPARDGAVSRGGRVKVLFEHPFYNLSAAQGQIGSVFTCEVVEVVEHFVPFVTIQMTGIFIDELGRVVLGDCPLVVVAEVASFHLWHRRASMTACCECQRA